ncbi:ATP-binding protein [Micromonospora matsumotoense]|uniref:AlbA family DNA-binding domain-containing protein n=1 Tax=Micromonospora matsumotoense TaxID=121616 RepID=UPI0033C5DBD2
METGGIESARTWLLAGRLACFVGLPESAWLDVKSGPYRLDDPGGAAELAKDIAAFANGGGGLLIVGFSTRREGGREIIEKLRPVPSGLVDLDRYRKLARERVQPHVRGLNITFISTDDDKGVLVIDVPRQHESAKPFIADILEGRRGPAVVGVPIRDGDATHWLSHSDLQKLLSAGWNALDGPRENIVLALHEAVASTLPMRDKPQVPLVGVGSGAMRREFETAYAAAGGESVLGHPTDAVTSLGPGFIQPLSGNSEQPGAILSALPGHGCAVVPDQIWESLYRAGGDANQESSISKIGLPKTPTDGIPLIIDRDSTVVELDGGSWRAGHLIRSSPHDPWTWRPIPQLDFQISYNTHWPDGGHVDVVVRAVLDISWRGYPQRSRSLSRAVRADHQALLPGTGFAAVLSSLSARRGARIAPPPWQPAGGQHTYHSGTSSHMRARVAAPDGASALAANAILQLGTLRSSSSVIGYVDLSINLAAWRNALVDSGASLPEDADIRLSLPEVIEVLTSAWSTALVLPTALAVSYDDLPLAAPPFIEMHMRAGTRADSGGGYRQLSLTDAVDLSILGETSEAFRSETGLRVVGPFGLNRASQRRMVAEGLDELALGWGHFNIDSEALFAEITDWPL